MKKFLLFLVLGMVLVLPQVALAGSTGSTGGTSGGGQEFATIYNLIKEWMEGTLGTILALAAFTVGLGMGVVRQSIMAVVLGIAMAITAHYGPDVIENVSVGAATTQNALVAIQSFLF